jgi:NADPH:quinone reductase-like Zn-dependent oxidoreductase
MKAWQISSFGIDNLELVDRPDPVAGFGEVVVKVGAVSLNYRDLRMVTGTYNPRLAMPRIPCSDGAGEVVAVGAGVTSVRVGDRVTGIFMQNWLDGELNSAKSKGALGGDIDGMLAEFVALKESGVIAIPDHLSFEEAATLPCAGVTAWNALTNASSTKAGDTVLIQGTGGVSLFALTFAKMLGARVLGTSGSDEKLGRARAIGLDAGHNYKTDPEWAAWVLDKTDDAGADLVVEVGGASTFQQSLKAVRAGGTVAQIGVLSGVRQDIELTPILHKQIKVHGIYVGSKANFAAMNRALVQSVASTGASAPASALISLNSLIDSVFDFPEAPRAFAAMEGASHFGKLVIRIG